MNHNEALEAAMIEAGFDPCNELARKSWQAGIEEYLKVRNSEAVGYVYGPEMQSGKGGFWVSREESNTYDQPLFPAPSAGRETVKVKELNWDTYLGDRWARHEAITPFGKYSAWPEGGSTPVDSQDRVDLQGKEVVKALEATYTAGFKASAEGWNGEHGCDTETDSDFLKMRDDYVRSLLSGHGGDNQ